MRKSIIMRGMILLHYILMVGMFVLCWGLLYKLGPSSKILGRDDLVICGTYALMLILFGRIYSAYQVGFYRVGEIVYGHVLANLLSLGITYIMACALARRLLSPMGGFGVAMLQTAFTGIWTFWANQLYFTLHKPKRTMVIYRRESDLNKLGEIKFFENRWNVEKQVQWNESNPHDIPQEEGKPASASLNDIHGLIGVMKDHETVFVSGVNATLRNGIVKYCVETGKDCYFVPHTGDVIISGAAHMRSFAVPICRARRSRPTPEYLLIKRAMDITLSIIAVIATSPLMLVTAIAIWRYDGGPVLYKQVRLTKNGRRFNILNLRWMQVVCELHKIQATIQTIICRRYTEFSLSSDFRHSIAGFAGVFAA